MIVKVKLLDPRTVGGHHMAQEALRPEVVANLPEYIHIDTDTLSVNDVDWCPGGRIWEIVPEDVAQCSAGDPTCTDRIRRGNFICEHMIEIGD